MKFLKEKFNVQIPKRDYSDLNKNFYNHKLIIKKCYN